MKGSSRTRLHSAIWQRISPQARRRRLPGWWSGMRPMLRKLRGSQWHGDELETALASYVNQARATFAGDATFGPILLARDVQTLVVALGNLRGDVQAGFSDVLERLDALLQEPEVKALVERKQGAAHFLELQS